MNSGYDRDSLEKALRAAGIGAGDVVYSHVAVGLLGRPRAGADAGVASELLWDAMRAVLGADGSWVVPAFTYSYSNGEVFDPAQSASKVGEFGEYFRTREEVVRSADPMLSVCAWGRRARELTDNLPRDCYGRDSIYARLLAANAWLCNVGAGLNQTTFVHHAEQMMSVPYRFIKKFDGVTRAGGLESRERWSYFARHRCTNAEADLSRLEAVCEREGIVRSAEIGRGKIVCVPLARIWDVCRREIARDPWFLAVGPPTQTFPSELQAAGA